MWTDITPRELFSAVCLTIVALAAVVGIFCRNYHENWLQFVGLVGVALWACARVSQLTDMMGTRLPAQGAMLHASLALYAMGTALKVWQHRPKPPDPWAATVAELAVNQAPYKLEPDQMRRVAGGKQ